LYASKKVALPITIRALMCHRENGMRSIRAIKSDALGAALEGMGITESL
jgi:hypothetical protein